MDILACRSDDYRPEPPANRVESNPDTFVSFDGKGYLSTAKAAKVTGYTPDYVGQLARAGTIPSRQVGNRWYVDHENIISHKKNKDALLAAVQTESVGIKRPDPDTGQFSDIKYSGFGPLLSHTSDSRELIPEVNAQSDEAETSIKIRKYEYSIPVNTMQHKCPPLIPLKLKIIMIMNRKCPLRQHIYPEKLATPCFFRPQR